MRREVLITLALALAMPSCGEERPRHVIIADDAELAVPVDPAMKRFWSSGDHSVYVESLVRDRQKVSVRLLWTFPYQPEDPDFDTRLIVDGHKLTGTIYMLNGTGKMGYLQTEFRCEFTLPQGMRRLRSLSLLVLIDDRPLTMHIFGPK